VRVLVVEDEPTVRNIVRRMLELSGHQVVLAEDGVEGVERFEESPESFDLAVLDLTMPRMNGIETMRALRQIRPDLPVLMTSGHAEEDSVQKVIRESDIAAFIQKPYRYGELMGKIRQLMARAGKSGRDPSS
jgi:CheY-like chemotaxis protein